MVWKSYPEAAIYMTFVSIPEPSTPSTAAPTGLRFDDVPLILEGAIPAAALALAVMAGFQGLERLLIPRGLRLSFDG